MESINKKEKQKNTKDVLKLGLIVFLYSSIPPTIYTIIFLATSFPIDWYLTELGVWKFGVNVGFVIVVWMLCVIPLTIPAMITKKLLFAGRRKRSISIIVLTLALVSAILAVSPQIIKILGKRSGLWMMRYGFFVIPGGVLVFVAGIIMNRRIYRKHFSKAEIPKENTSII